MITENLRMILPSGRECLINELTLEDIDRLSEGAQRREEALYDIMQQKIIIDPDGDKKQFVINDSPVADFFTAMVAVRRVTHGDDLTWSMRCDGCENQWKAFVDLGSDQFEPKMITWSKDEKDLFNGVSKKLHFLVKLSRPHEGVEVLRCRLLRGSDQKELDKILKKHKDKKMTEQGKLRIVGIEGKYLPEDKEKPEEKRRLVKPNADWFRTFPVRLWGEIDDAVQRLDGGIETSIEVVCPECGYIHFDYELPVNDKHFFSRRSARRT